MFGKRTVLVALMATTLVLSAVAMASATDPSGLTNALIGRGQASRSFEVHQRKGNDVAVNQITVQPAGFSGWHSHPGITVVACSPVSSPCSASRSPAASAGSAPTPPGRCSSSTPRSNTRLSIPAASLMCWRSRSSTCRRTMAPPGSTKPTPVTAEGQSTRRGMARAIFYTNPGGVPCRG